MNTNTEASIRRSEECRWYKTLFVFMPFVRFSFFLWYLVRFFSYFSFLLFFFSFVFPSFFFYFSSSFFLTDVLINNIPSFWWFILLPNELLHDHLLAWVLQVLLRSQLSRYVWKNIRAVLPNGFESLRCLYSLSLSPFSSRRVFFPALLASFCLSGISIG